MRRLPRRAGVAFRRAFERDKDDLREMGVPLGGEPRSRASIPAVEGYRIPKDRYYLRDPGLTPDELAALRLAASVVRLDGCRPGEGLLKLGGLRRGRPTTAGLEVGVAAGRPTWRPLFGAIAARSRCGSRTRTRSARSTPTGSTSAGVAGT